MQRVVVFAMDGWTDGLMDKGGLVRRWEFVGEGDDGLHLYNPPLNNASRGKDWGGVGCMVFKGVEIELWDLY